MNPVTDDVCDPLSFAVDWLPAAWAQAWQVTLLILAVALIVRACARRRPHLAHALWLVVLLKCVTPPIISSPFGVFCWLPPPGPLEPRPSLMSAANQAQRSASLALDLAQAATAIHSIKPDDELPAPLVDDGGVESERHEIAVVASAPAVSDGAGRLPGSNSEWRSVATAALLIVWPAGIGATSLLCAMRWLRCVRALRGPEVLHPEVARLLAHLSRRFGLRRRVRLKVTRDTIGPAVVGLWRPTVLLPEVVVRGAPLRDLEPILAHELLHIRRGDLWVSALQLAAGWLWWWHPLVWWTNRLIAREGERCCDEGVLAELGCPPLYYAKCLVDVLELKSLVSIPAFPGVRPVDITSSRLEQIMQIGNNSRKRSPWWCWLVLGLAASVALPGAVLVRASDVTAAGAGEDGQHAIEGSTLASQANVAVEEATPPAKEGRLPAESEMITVRVANSVEDLRLGQSVKIFIARMPTVDPDEVLRALPAEAGGWPFLAEIARDNVRIVAELVVDGLREARLYPMVGPARHLRCHYKCTVYSDKTTRSDWPIPFSHTDTVEEVVHIDHDHLIAEDAGAKDGSADISLETVQFVSSVPQKLNGDAHEIRVAARPETARRLREGMERGRLLVALGDDAIRSVNIMIADSKSLAAVVIEGNKSIATAEILKCIRTRKGRIVSRQQLREDVRVLMTKRWFYSVEARMGESSDGPVLIFRVVERPAEERAAVPVDP